MDEVSNAYSARPEPIIRQNCSKLTGHFKDQTFYGCTFDKLTGLSLEGCDLNQSSFITKKIEDALGFTVTLSCLSFQNVELSPLVFDLIICLLLKTKGNTYKRKQLIDTVLGKERAHELLSLMKTLELDSTPRCL